MGRIGFFGGSFNPPTNIHINVAKKLIKEGRVDKVVFVPVNDFYDKKDLVKARHRYNMLKLLTKGEEGLKVDDIEIKENRKLFAKDAFELIKKSRYAKGVSKQNIFLIMGSDNYKKMSEWKEYDRIKNQYNYLVIERDEEEIASTQIREMVKNNNSEVLKYIPKNVYKYIIKNCLYK